jgi:hypothetical protein
LYFDENMKPQVPRDLSRHLGIDVRQSFNDLSGRPIPILSDGEPIRELI